MSIAYPSALTRAAADRSKPTKGWLAAFGACAAILVWTVLVNLPVFGREDADDGFFVEVARLWAAGLPPYVHAYDIKAPGAFAVLAVASSLLGPSLATMKLVSLVASAASAAWLARLAAVRDRTAAVLIAILYPPLSLISGDVVYQLLNLVLIAGFAAAISSLRSRALLAGLAVGAACAIKQTAALDAFVMLFALAYPGDERRLTPSDLAGFVVAAALPPLAFFVYFLAVGAVGPFLRDVVVFALRRDSHISLGMALSALGLWLLPLAIPALVAALALADRKRIADRLPLALLVVWIAVEAISVALQRASYRTYLMPMLPPMLWIAASYLSSLYAKAGARRWLGLGGFVAITLYAAWVGHGQAMATRLPIADTTFLEAMKTRLSELGLRRGDRMFTLNGSPLLNAAVGVEAPTPFIHPGHLYCAFPGAGLPALRGVFEAKPRFVVDMFPNRRPGCLTPPYAEVIETALARDFKVVDEGRAGQTDYRIYERAY